MPEISQPVVPDPLVVIPCLNEGAHIGRLLRQFGPMVHRLGGRIVVVDGGSTDETCEIVAGFAAKDDRISLLHNPDRIQGAAINLAVNQDDGRATYLIRIDAHCAYPDDYCDVLMQQAKSVYADSIVVSMIAAGDNPVQRINAATQNTALGNGGSAHRNHPEGAYVDHGHHALIKIAAFRAVGGYDPGFSHNEDGEFDHRLRQAGYRIWLTGATMVTYYPRSSWPALARQYFNHGAGRARNILKHSVVPRLRQAKVMMVLPALLMAGFLPLHWMFGVPLLVWSVYCIGTGLKMAARGRDPALALCGIAAMIMHLSWSLGFWQSVLRNAFNPSAKVAS